ncbi:hypothetical protein [Streptacidiphilus rugosus]|uniref:hypothetical protein n=1 Tax=Streptacidiphilus rugosus TaxID=405783 RepID=UPI00055E6D87|nr:hypothetical protein [Streptacidiphilus rugosus]
MGGWVWVLIPLVLGGGGWVGDTVRRSQKNRHERQLARIEATTRKQDALEAAGRPPVPICGCEHHLAKHDTSGKCHEEVQAPAAWDADGKVLRYETKQCNCQRYVGPEPLGTVFAAEITDLDR